MPPKSNEDPTTPSICPQSSLPANFSVVIDASGTVTLDTVEKPKCITVIAVELLGGDVNIKSVPLML